MNILTISFIGVLTATVSLTLRRHNPEIALVAAIIGSVLIFLSVILNLNSVYETVKTIFDTASVNSVYVAILLKTVGISLLTEFSCDCCIDAGQKALAGNISLAGKILVLVTAIPLYKDVLDAVLSLTGST